MSTSNEHLQRAESLIEQLEAQWAETATSQDPDWSKENTAKLAELHLLAANARANIRSAFTLQHIAALMAGDPDTPATDPDTPGDTTWETPARRVLPFPLPKRKQT